MAAGLVPALQFDGDPRQRGQRSDVLGELLGDPQVLSVGTFDVVLPPQHSRVIQTRLAIVAVQTENVAELDDGAGRVSGLDQGERVLIVLRRAFLGRLTGSQNEDEGECASEA